MPTVPGLSRIRTANLHLAGRPGTMVQLLDADSAPFLITNAYKVKVEFMLNPDTAVVLTKQSSAGEVTVLNTAGYIYVPLAVEDVALFRGAGKLVVLRATVLYVADGVTIKLVNDFFLIPLSTFYVWSQPTEVPMALSTEFFNTAVSALGEAFLDTILTVNQPVGCTLKISINKDTPPESWILRTATDASVAGATRRAVDYADPANTKVWFRE